MKFLLSIACSSFSCISCDQIHGCENDFTNREIACLSFNIEFASEFELEGFLMHKKVN